VSAQAFDPLAVLRELHAHGVDFVCIGGFAAYLQGSAIPTVDVDIVPDSARDNLTRLSDALRALGARVRNGDDEPLPFAHDATNLAGSVFWNLTTRHGDLDISFTPSGTQGFPDLRQDAITVDLHGTPVLLASLADVIRSKEAAGRPKDLRVLPGLRKLLDEQRRSS
jgi:hypothetical protein